MTSPPHDDGSVPLHIPPFNRKFATYAGKSSRMPLFAADLEEVVPELAIEFRSGEKNCSSPGFPRLAPSSRAAEHSAPPRNASAGFLGNVQSARCMCTTVMRAGAHQKTPPHDCKRSRREAHAAASSLFCAGLYAPCVSASCTAAACEGYGSVYTGRDVRCRMIQ